MSGKTVGIELDDWIKLTGMGIGLACLILILCISFCTKSRWSSSFRILCPCFHKKRSHGEVQKHANGHPEYVCMFGEVIATHEFDANFEIQNTNNESQGIYNSPISVTASTVEPVYEELPHYIPTSNAYNEFQTTLKFWRKMEYDGST